MQPGAVGGQVPAQVAGVDPAELAGPAGPATRASVMTEQIGATTEAAKLLSDLIS